MTKALLYYFSGTGNNLFIAKEIAKRIPGSVIRPIKELEHNKKIEESYDWIGFLSPSYYSHIPPYMKECMSGLTFAQHQKVFLVAGCAGNRGMAIQDMREQVNAAGKETSLEYMVIQPGNFLLSYGAFPRIYQNVTILLAKCKTKKIVKDIKKDRTRTNLKPGMFYKASDEARLQSNIKELGKRGNNFLVNQSCVQCKICTKVCPVGNIRLTDGKIVFGDHCNQCMACIQWCPKRAIYVDEKEQKRKRYHHPMIQVMELVGKNENKSSKLL